MCPSRRSRWRARPRPPSTPAPASCISICASRRRQGSSALVGSQRQQGDPAGDPRGLPGRHHQPHHRHLGPAIISGALDCVRETRPEIAACNAGSLNYLKVKADNTWAWPPMMFDNAVEKVQDYLDVMKAADTIPEFECFDVGIVRCVGMYRQTGMYSGPLEYNFVMGVASGMPADPDLLPILLKLKLPEAHWQVTAIGRAEIWPLHQRCADLGGHLRTGLEDTFYLGRRHQGDLERPVDRGHRRLRPPRRTRDREPRRSAARFLGSGIELSFRGARSANRRCAVRTIGNLRDSGSGPSEHPGMTPSRGAQHGQSRSNRRRAGAGPHRAGGDRRSPETRGAAVSRPDRGHRRRADA